MTAREVAWCPLWTTLQTRTGWTYSIAVDKNKQDAEVHVEWGEKKYRKWNQDVSAGWCFLVCACCMSHLPPRKWPPKVSSKESCYTLFGIWKTAPIKIWREWSLKLLAWLKKVTCRTCKEGKIRFFCFPMTHTALVNSKPIKRFSPFTHQ